MKDNHAGTEHLLLGLIAVKSPCSDLLRHADITIDKTRSYLLICRAQQHYNDKKFSAACSDAQAAVADWPQDADTQNFLAWLYATCPVASLRHGEKALHHAQLACNLATVPHFSLLSTLAAACAEAGDFPRAVAVQQQALALAPAEEQSKYTDMLKLFQQREALRVA